MLGTPKPRRRQDTDSLSVCHWAQCTSPSPAYSLNDHSFLSKGGGSITFIFFRSAQRGDTCPPCPPCPPPWLRPWCLSARQLRVLPTFTYVRLTRLKPLLQWFSGKTSSREHTPCVHIIDTLNILRCLWFIWYTISRTNSSSNLLVYVGYNSLRLPRTT